MDQNNSLEVYTDSLIERKFHVKVVDSNKDLNNLHCPFEDTAYAFNVRAGIESVPLEGRNRVERRSVVYIYFVNQTGETLCVTSYCNYYFYVGIRSSLIGISTTGWDNYRHQIVTFLESLAVDRCREKVEISITTKIDLCSTSHLQKSTNDPYKPRDVIRLSFTTIEDARILRRDLQQRIQKNNRRIQSLISKLQQESGENFVDDISTIDNSPHHPTFHGFRQELVASLDEDPFLLADNIFEYDIPLVTRMCIDMGIRCGRWYRIKCHFKQPVKIVPCEESEQGVRPPLRYLAWDIEVTKDRLKFPTPCKDSISLVSFMYDKQGVLIVNRSILSQDIHQFNYTPKPEYPGTFHVLNVKDEKELILAFYQYIHTISPHIFVTYNGDNFDFEFLRLRGLRYGISMLEEIGFPYSTMDGLVPARLGEPITTRTALGVRQEYQGRYQVHMDCLRWVERDSYLPCGSRGLKAVTKTKLGYDPRELDPELMERYAVEQPTLLAEYSVSDAVATYYLYEKYIHGFTFALASIIPFSPDDVLRKGSGTLCENLLMAKAYEANVLFPNKYNEPLEKWKDNRLLVNETYTGGSVAQLHSGIFRSDIQESFQLNTKAYELLIKDIDNIFDYWFTYDEGKDIPRDDVVNLDEVIADIRKQLRLYTHSGCIKEEPSIYHYDVAAMYPNIILSNRLQPTSIMTESKNCKYCPYFNERKECQRMMQWQWKGEVFPLSRAQVQFVRDQLAGECFAVEEEEEEEGIKRNRSDAIRNDKDSSEDYEHPRDPSPPATIDYNHKFRPNHQDNATHSLPTETFKSWNELTEKQKNLQLIERLKLISRKQTKKFKVAVGETRNAIVCMRENAFYVETVREFRDRRYELKTKKRHAETQCAIVTDIEAREKWQSDIVLYDSLQLAHKCILNSFYGYVMRKGSRWYSMEMAAIVTYTGAQIIHLAHNFLNGVGKPLEMDTDGIWTLLPKQFPQSFRILYKQQKDNSICHKKLNFVCSVLNYKVFKSFSNPQYMTFDSESGRFQTSVEHCVSFEVDGPYKAINLPASEKEGMSVKKRYAVFDDNHRIVELKGFELKRRGELELIKVFQEEVFPEFLKGKTRQEAYAAVAFIANRWLDFLDTRGQAADDITEVFNLIAESKFMSKPVSTQLNSKSMGITTAKRLTELLGDPTYINEKGIKCEYVVCASGEMEKTLRAIPILLFEAPLYVQQLYLQRWLGLSPSVAKDPRSFLDWAYYRQRLETAILKIIVIPALLQGQTNPVPRVVPPEWILRNASLTRSNQTRLSSFFSSVPLPNEPMDIESLPRYKANTIPTIHPPFTHDEPSPQERRTSWLMERQRRWKISRKKLMDIRRQRHVLQNSISKGQGSSNNTNDTSIPSQVFYKRPDQYDNEFIEWFIVDIEYDTHQPGLLHFYAILGHLPYSIFRIPVFHLRRIIINSTSSTFTLKEKDICVEKLQSPQSYILPRGFQQHHLYKLHMSEEKFHQHHSSFRPTGHVVSVYGKYRPLDFDILFCYGTIEIMDCLSLLFFLCPTFNESVMFSGDTVRVNSHYQGNQTYTLECCSPQALCGPDALEPVQRKIEKKDQKNVPQVRWVFLIVLHDGPADNPDRVIGFFVHPPLFANQPTSATVQGKITILLGGSIPYHQKHNHLAELKSIFLHVVMSKKSKIPSCFSSKENAKEDILKHWLFTDPHYFATTNQALSQFQSYIEQSCTQAVLAKEPPLAVSIITSLPPSILGSWANPNARCRISSPMVPLHVVHLSLTSYKINSHRFYSETTKIAVQQFLEKLYLVEWSTVVATAIQIPVIKLLQWTLSPHQLHKNILDLMLARGLQANKMIPWDSEEIMPDLGTPVIQNRIITDFELPNEKERLNSIVHPSISWTVTFRLGFSGQLSTEALTHLDKLAQIYNDPLRHAFLSNSYVKTHNYAVSNGSSLARHLPYEETIDDIPEDEHFQHTSNIPYKTIIVLHRCLHHLDRRIRALNDSKAIATLPPYDDALNFLTATTQHVQAWQDTPTSLFFDPVLQKVIKYWISRYMQSLVQEIKNVSENCVEPLLLTPATLIISTPALSLTKAQNCLKLLFRALQKQPLFANLHPQSCTAYRGFLLFNHLTYMGLRLAHPHQNTPTGWENKLHGLLRPFPEPIQYFLQRVVEDLVTFPLRSAGLSPDQEFASNEEELDKLQAVTHCAQQLILPEPPQHFLHNNVLAFTKTCVLKLQDFSQLKEEWCNSGRKITWESLMYKKYETKMNTIKQLLKFPYLSVNTHESLKVRLRKLHQQQLELLHKTFPISNIWSINDCPGLYKLHPVESARLLDATDLCGRTLSNQVVQLMPSLNENQLQLAIARVLYALLLCHPHYWTLQNESRETWVEIFASALHISAYSTTLEYESLYSPLIPLNSLSCTHCGQTFSINLTASLLENPSTLDPYWECPFCCLTLDVKQLEAHLLESFYIMIEAAQAQDIVCIKCRQVQKSLSSCFCHCGGDYHCRISQIEFMLLWMTFHSLADKYPLHFPILYATIEQTILFKCL